jgi:putative Ca2+/H+ antiporter (TMEM165/GDT1 family)
MSCDAKKTSRSFSIREKFKYLESKPNIFFLLWGSLLSFACLGEVIILEAAIIWTSIGVISDSQLQAIIYGGSAMFVLALGASIPLIIVATLSSSFRKYFSSVEKLESIRSIGGVVLIILGLLYIIGLISYFISLF